MKKIALVMAMVIAMKTSAIAQYAPQYDDDNPAVIKTQALIDEVYGKNVLSATFNTEILEIAQREGVLDRKGLICVVNEDNKMSSGTNYQPKNTNSEAIAPNVSKTTSNVFDFYGVRFGQTIETACKILSNATGKELKVMDAEGFNGSTRYCYLPTDAGRETVIEDKNGIISKILVDEEVLDALKLPKTPKELEAALRTNYLLASGSEIGYNNQDDKEETFNGSNGTYSFLIDYLPFAFSDYVRLEVNFLKGGDEDHGKPNELGTLTAESATDITFTEAQCDTISYNFIQKAIPLFAKLGETDAMVALMETETGMLSIIKMGICDGDPQDSMDKMMYKKLLAKEKNGTISKKPVAWLSSMAQMAKTGIEEERKETGAKEETFQETIMNQLFTPSFEEKCATSNAYVDNTMAPGRTTEERMALEGSLTKHTEGLYQLLTKKMCADMGIQNFPEHIETLYWDLAHKSVYGNLNTDINETLAKSLKGESVDFGGNQSENISPAADIEEGDPGVPEHISNQHDENGAEIKRLLKKYSCSELTEMYKNESTNTKHESYSLYHLHTVQMYGLFYAKEDKCEEKRTKEGWDVLGKIEEQTFVRHFEWAKEQKD